MVVATGRMYRSVRPYLELAGIDDLVVCYQGAAVVDPRDGTFLVHEPIALDVAREAIAALLEHGYQPNVYVDDELVVAEQTPYSHAYAGFQHLPVSEVGDLLAWLERPPTKLVAVGDPDELPVLRAALAERFGGRLFLTDLAALAARARASRASRRGRGSPGWQRDSASRRRDVVAFGDGENDLELLEEAGFGIAIEGSHERARRDGGLDVSSPGGRRGRARDRRVLTLPRMIDLKAARAEPERVAGGARAQGRRGGVRSRARGRRALACPRPASSTSCAGAPS